MMKKKILSLSRNLFLALTPQKRYAASGVHNWGHGSNMATAYERFMYLHDRPAERTTLGTWKYGLWGGDRPRRQAQEGKQGSIITGGCPAPHVTTWTLHRGGERQGESDMQ